MKLAERHNTVRSGGVIGDQTQFNIEMNAKMFRVLSDTMYEDKIGSMVRELSCNAFDAHVEAGKPDVPFTIHLPNELEPWFSVKDEGIGLSDENIRKIYTSYGNSTKDGSNAVIGAFGLGSKTPFAYTDQFTVISIHGGVKRVYVAVMDGMPTLSMQAEEPTDEHPGLEVMVSVDAQDFMRFGDAVATQLKFFKVKPTLINNFHEVDFPDMITNVSVSNDLVTIYGRSTAGYGCRSPIHSLYVVQGGVGYPVRVQTLADHLNKEALELARHLDALGAYMEFPIGSIEVTASREGISYKERTIASIRDRLNEISKVLSKEVFEKISSIKNTWDRAAHFNTLSDFERVLLGNHSGFAAIRDSLNIVNRTAYISLSAFITKGNPAEKFSVFEYSLNNSWRARNSTNWYREHATGVTTNPRIEPSDSKVVFVRDTTKSPVARLRLFWEESHGRKPLIMIETNQINKKGKFDVDSFTDNTLKMLSRALGGVEIRRISDLPMPPRASRAKGESGKYRQPRAWACDYREAFEGSRGWEPVYDLDEVDNGIYIPVDRHSFHDDLRRLDYIMAIRARQAGVVDGEFYAVNMKRAEKLENDPNWTSIFTVIEELKEKLPKAQRIHDILTRSQLIVDSFHGNELVNELMPYMDQFEKGSSVYTMLFKYNIASKRANYYWNMFSKQFGYLSVNMTSNYSVGIYGDNEKGNALKKEMNELANDVYQKFPLLRNFGNYRRNTEEKELLVQHMIQYVNMVSGA